MSCSTFIADAGPAGAEAAAGAAVAAAVGAFRKKCGAAGGRVKRVAVIAASMPTQGIVGSHLVACRSQARQVRPDGHELREDIAEMMLSTVVSVSTLGLEPCAVARDRALKCRLPLPRATGRAPRRRRSGRPRTASRPPRARMPLQLLPHRHRTLQLLLFKAPHCRALRGHDDAC